MSETPNTTEHRYDALHLITEEVLRHLVIRDERKGAAALRDFNLDGGTPARLELDADDTEGEIAAAAAAAAAADGE